MPAKAARNSSKEEIIGVSKPLTIFFASFQPFHAPTTNLIEGTLVRQGAVSVSEMYARGLSV